MAVRANYSRPSVRLDRGKVRLEADFARQVGALLRRHFFAVFDTFSAMGISYCFMWTLLGKRLFLGSFVLWFVCQY